MLKMVTMIFLLFPLYWQYFSLIYLQSGGYSSELDFYGKETSAALFLLLLIQLAIFIICISSIGKVKKGQARMIGVMPVSVRFFVLALASLLVTVLLAYGITNSFPVFSGTHRFDYWFHQKYDLRIVFGWFYFIAIGLGFFLREKPRTIIIILLIYTVLLILYSNKFTLIFYTLLYFMFGVFLRQDVVPHKFWWILGCVLAFPLLLLTGWASANGVMSYLFGDWFVDRALGNQGHFFYIANNYPGRLSFRELFGGQELAINALMYEFSKTSFVNGIIEKGFRFSGIFPAILIFLYGKIGAAIIFSIIISAIIPVLRIIRYMLFRGSLVGYLAAAKLFGFLQIILAGSFDEVFLNGVFWGILVILMFLGLLYGFAGKVRCSEGYNS